MVQALRREATLVTVDDFLQLSLPEGKAELVRGDLRVTPPAAGAHGLVATNLLLLLGAHVRARGLGRVFADGTGYELMRLPHTVRVPDASFVRADRLPVGGIGQGPLRLAPDLAIEVLSPSETASQLDEKLRDYSLAGTPVIWVIDPPRRTVMAIAAGAPARWFGEDDRLDGGETVPGFSCPVAEIFEGLA